MGKIFVRFSTPGGRGYIEGKTTHVLRPGWVDVKSIADVSQSVKGHSSPKTGDPATAWVIELPYSDALAAKLANFKTTGQEIDKVVIDFTRGGDDSAVFLRMLLYSAFVTDIDLGTRKDGKKPETITIRLEPETVITANPVRDPQEQQSVGIKNSPPPATAPAAAPAAPTP